MPAPVHPHARGDDASIDRVSHGVDGSPPRAWGRHRQPVDGRGIAGSPPRAWGRRYGRDDPMRVRAGSPPRAWGRRSATSGSDPTVGSPPRAWGRLATTVAQRVMLPVHPHARGDDGVTSTVSAGSSRFTPTRVGTTAMPPLISDARVGSPPRAWGRHADRLARRRRRAGSPPRAWGRRLIGAASMRRCYRFTPTRVGTTLIIGDAPACDDRSTPTRVGTTSVMTDAADRGRFTPTRVGTTIGDDPPSRAHGSPPRAWGRRTTTAGVAGRNRFTPTRVGTTSRIRSTCDQYAVHPHARGDDVARRSTAVRPSAVHPHARGDDCRCRAVPACLRFTPTRVGTTSAQCRRSHTRRFTPTRVGTTRLRRPSTVLHRFTPTRVGTTSDHAGPMRRAIRFTPTRVGTTAVVSRSDGAACGSPPRAWGRPTDA